MTKPASYRAFVYNVLLLKLASKVVYDANVQLLLGCHLQYKIQLAGFTVYGDVLNQEDKNQEEM